jgi:hypothetical protein
VGYPNLEKLTGDWLRANVFVATGPDRVRVADEWPDNLQHAARVVCIQRSETSPGDTQVTMDVADLDVDCFARTRQRAMDLAEQVRAELRLRFLHYTDPQTGAFIHKVQTFSGPAVAPYDSSLVVRVAATYRVSVHVDPS